MLWRNTGPVSGRTANGKLLSVSTVLDATQHIGGTHFSICPKYWKFQVDPSTRYNVMFFVCTLCTTATVPSYIVHHWPVLCTMVCKGDLFISNMNLRNHPNNFLEVHMTHRPSIVFRWFTRYTQIQETLWRMTFALIAHAKIQSAYLHKHHYLVERIPQYMRCRPWLQLLSNMCNMCCHRLEIKGKLLCTEATEPHLFLKHQLCADGV